MAPAKASFSHPAGLDVMVCFQQKKEICFVADQGNHVIRYIDGVKSINCSKLVGTLKLHPVPEKWRPEGLAVINGTTLAITAGTILVIARLDKSLLNGQLIKIVSNLQSPRGLCFHPRKSNTIMVADGNVVKEINTSSKETSVVAQGFQTAFDISVAVNGQIGITDVGSHKVHLLEWEDDESAWVTSTVIGSGNAGCRDGNATTAELHEPTGITFEMNSALICCIGGRDHGCIKLYSQLGFAAEFMSSIRNIYDAIGFLPKKEHNKKRKSYHTPILPFTDGIRKLSSSLAYMENIMSKRKAHLKKSCLDGSDGSIYTQTLEGFSESVISLQYHSSAFEELDIDSAYMNLYAFTNESRKEHNFAKHKQSGQYRHPTMQQYSRAKGCEEEQIKKLCECPHSYHTNAFQAYQATHKSPLSSISVIKEYREIKDNLRHEEIALTEEENTSLKEDIKKARVMNMPTKALPTQNVRDVYRARCGYAPCIIEQVDAALFQDKDACERYYPSFEQLMDELNEDIDNNDVNTNIAKNNDYSLLVGDIVAVNPGKENGIPSGDKWWLLQVNKALPCTKSSSGCHVSGFWLEMLPSSQQPEQGCALKLQRDSAKTYYGSLIKKDDKPAVIPVEELNSGWRDGAAVYKLTQEFAHSLDEISDDFRHCLDKPDERELQSSDSGSEDDAMTRELAHSVQEEVLQLSRRRIIRGREGQNIRSYAELCGQRQTKIIRQKRTHMLGLSTDIVVSADKD